MSKKEFTFREFQDILVEILDLKRDSIKEDIIISEKLGIDSLGLVNLGLKIQKELEIEMSPVDMVEIQTIGQFYDKVKRLVENKAA